MIITTLGGPVDGGVWDVYSDEENPCSVVSFTCVGRGDTLAVQMTSFSRIVHHVYTDPDFDDAGDDLIFYYVAVYVKTEELDGEDRAIFAYSRLVASKNA